MATLNLNLSRDRNRQFLGRCLLRRKELIARLLFLIIIWGTFRSWPAHISCIQILNGVLLQIRNFTWNSNSSPNSLNLLHSMAHNLFWHIFHLASFSFPATLLMSILLSASVISCTVCVEDTFAHNIIMHTLEEICKMDQLRHSFALTMCTRGRTNYIKL